jgi:hypothetical protein
LAARRVADEDHTRGVKDRVSCREIANMVNGGRDIVECAWPSAANIAHASILGNPHGVASLRQRRRRGRNMSEIVHCAPATAMNEDYGRRASRCARRKPKLAELQRTRTVRLTMVRGRRRCCSKLGERDHGSGFDSVRCPTTFRPRGRTTNYDREDCGRRSYWQPKAPSA